MIAVPKLFNRPLTLPKVRLQLSADEIRRFVLQQLSHAVATVRNTATASVAATTVAAEKTKKKAKRRIKKLKPYRKNAWMAGVVVAAIAAPQLTLLWRPLVGIYVTAAALIALLALGLTKKKARQLAISAAILPTTMLVALSLPQTDAFARSAIFYDSVLLLALFYGYVFTLDEPQSTLSLGKKYIVLLPLMVILGQGLGVLGFGMLKGMYPYHGTPVALVAATAVVFAMAEELLFRGLIQHQATKVVHPIIAAVLSVLAYTVVLATHGSLLPAGFALIAGIVLSTTYYFKQNLVLTTTLNAVMKLTYVGLIATFVLR